MNKTIHYARIERIDYKFTESEIQDALMKIEKITPYVANRKEEFEIFEDSDGTHCAVLTLIFEKPAKEVEDDQG